MDEAVAKIKAKDPKNAETVVNSIIGKIKEPEAEEAVNLTETPVSVTPRPVPLNIE